MELIKSVQFTKGQLIEAAQEDIAAISDALQCYMPCAANKSLQKSLILKKIALASLNAKPIGAFHIADQQVEATTDYIKDGEWPICNGVIEVYAAPSALQERREAEAEQRKYEIGESTMRRIFEPAGITDVSDLQIIFDQVENVLNSPVVPEEIPMPKASEMSPIDAVVAIAEVRGWNACRAAMLKGGAK